MITSRKPWLCHYITPGRTVWMHRPRVKSSTGTLRNHEPILKLLQLMLSPGGVAWFGDGGRWRAERFSQLLPDYGFRADIFDEAGQRLSQPRAGRFQLFAVTRI